MLFKDRNCLLGILESIEKILEYSQDIKDADSLHSNLLIFDACLMNIVNIGELVNRLSTEFTYEHDEIDWFKILGLRNIIAHDYFGVDYDEIWTIIKAHIPVLKSFIVKVL